jgi:uncharacterized protein
MTKKIMWLCLSALLLLVGCTLRKQNYQYVNQESSLLWKIQDSDGGPESYLFGTWHLMCVNDSLPMGLIRQVRASQKKLILEVDISDLSIVTKMAQSMAMGDKGKISDYLLGSQVDSLNQFFLKTIGSPLSVLEQVQPIFLVSMILPHYMGCQVKSMEQELVRLLPNLKVSGLETADKHMSFFDSMDVEQQLSSLLRLMREPNEGFEQVATLRELYSSQNMEGIYNHTFSSEPTLHEFYDIILNKRNVQWIQDLMPILKSEPVFIAVGAGHLGGPEGMIRLLKDAGFTLTPIESK